MQAVKLILLLGIFTINIIASNLQKDDIALTSQEKQFLKTHNKISVHMENNYIPFSNIDNNKKFVGYSIDYANMIANKLGIKFIYNKNENWNQAISNLKNKKIDIIAQAINTKERQSFALFTKGYMTYHQSIVVKKKNMHLNTLESLQGYKVGIVSGYNLEKVIRISYPNIKLIGFSDNETLLNAILLNKIDASISTHQVMQYNINSLLLKDIISIPILHNQNVTKTIEAFAVRKDFSLLHSALDKAFASVLEEDISKLQLKWFGENSIHTDNSLILSSWEKEYLTNKQTIRMCNNPNWQPIEFAQNNNFNNMQGIAIDTIKVLEKKLNIKFQNIPTQSWKESQQFLKEKKCDILPCAVKTTKREEYANFTKPYLNLPLAIFTTKDKQIVSGLDEIMDKPWTRQKGSGLITKLKKSYPNMKVIETKGDKEALQYVNGGKAYFTIATLPVASHVISKFQLNDLHVAGYTGMVYNLSIAVRGDDKTLLNILDKALEDISKTKSKQIMKKWVTSPIKESIIDYDMILYILLILLIIVILFIYKQYLLNRSIKEANELINATMEAIILHQNGICIDLNQSALEMFGFKDKTDFIGKNILLQIAPESKELVKQQMTIDDTKQYEIALLKEDGTKFYGLVHGKLIRNKSLRLASVIDITTLKEQEKLISQQAKMASMGEMIGNIAHQWRQPLSAMSTCATGILLQKEYDNLSDEFLNEACQTIDKNAQYLSKTIDDFKNFIKGDMKKQLFTIEDEINSFLNLVNSSIKNDHIKIVLNLQKNLEINSYQNELTQCLINIFNNAVDALKEKNENDRFIFIDTLIKNNNIIIRLKDSADGIPKEVLPKIFEPYFTTKHKSQGTGLGLHMTYNIITNAMNGTIEASNIQFKHENKEYTGAQFEISLPTD